MKVIIEVKDELIADLLVSAIEGGANYWCSLQSWKAPKDLKFRLDKKHSFPHIDYPMNVGGSITISDLEDNEKKYVITKSMLYRAIRIMATSHFKDFSDLVGEDFDGTTGDIFLQCAIFGKVIYG